jgi:hypothetical protein
LYFDNVRISRRTLEEYAEHPRLVLQRFKEEGLKLRLNKHFFGLQEMDYLPCTITGGRLSVSTKNVEAV